MLIMYTSHIFNTISTRVLKHFHISFFKGSRGMDFIMIKSLALVLVFISTIQCSLYRTSNYAALDEFQFRIFPSLDSIELSCSAERLKKSEKIKTTLNGVDIATYEIIDLKAGKYGCALEASRATFTLESGFENLKHLDIVEIAFHAKGADGHPTIEFETVDLNLINTCYKDDRELELNFWDINAGIEDKGLILRDEASGSYVCNIDAKTVLKFSFERIDHIPRITDYWMKLVATEKFTTLAVSCTIKDYPDLKTSDLKMRMSRGLDWPSAGYSENTNTVHYDASYLAQPYVFKCSAENKYGYDVVAFEFNNKNVTPLITGESWHIHANLNAKSISLNHIVSRSNKFGHKLRQNGREVELFVDPKAPNSKRFITNLEKFNQFSYDYNSGKKFDYTFVVKGYTPKVTTFNIEYRPTKHIKMTCDGDLKVLPIESSIYYNNQPLEVFKQLDTYQRGHATINSIKTGTYKCRIESETGFDEVTFDVKEEADKRPSGVHHYDKALGGKTSNRTEYYVRGKYLYKNEMKKEDFCVPNPHKVYSSPKAAARDNPAATRIEAAEAICYPMDMTRFLFDFSRPNY